MTFSGALASISGILIVLIVFGALLAGVTIVCWTIVRLVTGGGRGNAASAEETQLMQELYHGLSKMEQRVEALETLLLERDHRGDPS